MFRSETRFLNQTNAEDWLRHLIEKGYDTWSEDVITTISYVASAQTGNQRALLKWMRDNLDQKMSPSGDMVYYPAGSAPEDDDDYIRAYDYVIRKFDSRLPYIKMNTLCRKSNMKHDLVKRAVYELQDEGMLTVAKDGMIRRTTAELTSKTEPVTVEIPRDAPQQPGESLKEYSDRMLAIYDETIDRNAYVDPNL